MRSYMFRNIGIEPTGDVETDLRIGNLDWHTARRPMASVGVCSTIEIPGQFTLHRSDGKGPGMGFLGTCTNQYHPPQNRGMFEMFYKLADAGGLKLERIGELNGGRRVFALAMSDRKESVTVGDVVQLGALLTTGHVPGMAYILKLFAKRLWCSNGCTTSERAAMWRMSHRTRFDDTHRAKMQAALEAGEARFGEYVSAARAMFDVMFPEPIQANLITAAYQPDLLASVIAETEGLVGHKAMLARADGRPEAERNAMALRAVVEHGSITLPTKALQRGTRQAIDAIQRQPGDTSRTVWNAVNAVTYHVDHVRGRSSDSGVEAAYFGAGEQVKNRAMTLGNVVVEYVQH